MDHPTMYYTHINPDALPITSYTYPDRHRHSGFQTFKTIVLPAKGRKKDHYRTYGAMRHVRPLPAGTGSHQSSGEILLLADSIATKTSPDPHELVLQTSRSDARLQ